MNTSGQHGKIGHIVPNHYEEIVQETERGNVWILLRMKPDVKKKKRSLHKLVEKTTAQVYLSLRRQVEA